MNDGVPSTMPVRVRLESVMRAMPKSVTLTVPVAGSSITLAGLMSRCTTPWLCAYASACATRATVRSTIGTGSNWPGVV